MTLSVRLWDRDFRGLPIPPGLEMSVSGLGWAVPGGPAWADIQVSGRPSNLEQVLMWLRCPVEISNDTGDHVWWGYVHQVSVTLSGTQYTLSLDKVSNRVTASWRDTDNQEHWTDWAEDTGSMSEYGRMEMRVSQAGDNMGAAEARRDLELALRSYPHVEIAPAGSAGDGATLSCRGWWHTLGWEYYSRADGLVEHTAGNATLPLGLGLVDNTIGFDGDNERILDLYARLNRIRANDWVEVAGSASNDGTYQVESSSNQEAEAYTNTTISFSGNRISDSAKGLGFIDANDIIQVSGSASNDGYYSVAAGAGDGSWVDVDQALTTEAAGASVTIRNGKGIKVRANLLDELPGTNNVTVYLVGSWGILQQFRQSSGVAWTVDRVQVHLGRVGNPPGGLQVAIRADNGSNQPGTILESVTLTPSQIPEKAGWVDVALSNTTSLASGTPYWLEVYAQGPLDPANHYLVGIDPDGSYTDGTAWTYDVNQVYIPTPEPISLRFRVLGGTDTTEQMSQMATAAQFLARAVVEQTSGIVSNQYRDGTRTILEEMEDLLAMGHSGARSMVAIVERGRELHLSREPDPPFSARYRISRDGNLVDHYGRPLPEGVCPVGVWASPLEGILVDASSARMDPVWIVRCDYDPETGRRRWQPRGALDLAELWARAMSRTR